MLGCHQKLFFHLQNIKQLVHKDKKPNLVSTRFDDLNALHRVGGANAKVDMEEFSWYVPYCTPSQYTKRCATK